MFVRKVEKVRSGSMLKLFNSLHLRVRAFRREFNCKFYSWYKYLSNGLISCSFVFSWDIFAVYNHNKIHP